MRALRRFAVADNVDYSDEFVHIFEKNVALVEVLRSLVRSRLHESNVFFENVNGLNEISTFFNEKRVADGSPQIYFRKMK